MKQTSKLVALALMTAAFGAQAQIYKWVDEKGVTRYTETLPPTKKAQEMRVVAPPARSAAEPARYAAQATKPATESRPSIKLIYDRNRLLGSWATLPTELDQVSIVLAPVNSASATDLVVSQRWVRAGKMGFKSNMRYRIAIGGGGRGLLETNEAADANMPAKIAYTLDGSTLILSLSDGEYAGQHRLTKLK